MKITNEQPRVDDSSVEPLMREAQFWLQAGHVVHIYRIISNMSMKVFVREKKCQMIINK
jgi:hypothetical protein